MASGCRQCRHLETSVPRRVPYRPNASRPPGLGQVPASASPERRPPRPTLGLSAPRAPATVPPPTEGQSGPAVSAGWRHGTGAVRPPPRRVEDRCREEQWRRGATVHGTRTGREHERRGSDRSGRCAERLQVRADACAARLGTARLGGAVAALAMFPGLETSNVAEGSAGAFTVC